MRRAGAKSWDELRRRVLEDGYLSISQLEERRRKARLLKRSLWLVPLYCVGLGAAVLGGGAPWYLWVGLALVTSGAVDFSRTGRRWESRWTELITARSEQASR
jgi:hypothetical protein